MRSRIRHFFHFFLIGLLAAVVTAQSGTANAQSAVVYRESKEFAAAIEAYENQDFETAFTHWLHLAWRDDLAAQRNLGHLYRYGLGKPQSFEEAFNWYQRAAEKGLAGAQANLADMYERGQGREKDLKRAMEWFLTAAEQGHVIAQYRLALMLIRGEEDGRRQKHALQWFTIAAEAGYEPAVRHAIRLKAKMERTQK
jgi:uncharacterized protein